MVQEGILGGVNTTGLFRNVKRPAKTTRIAKGLPCPKKRIIVNFSVPMVKTMAAALAHKLLRAIVVTLNTLVL